MHQITTYAVNLGQCQRL